jgi:glycosyltransferase involved in cell wall biosynthesis
MKNNKILLFTGSLKFSGSATWIINLALCLQDNGQEVHVLSTSSDKNVNIPQSIKISYIPKARKKIRFKLAHIIQLKKWAPKFYVKLHSKYLNKKVYQELAQLEAVKSFDVIFQNITTERPHTLSSYSCIGVIHQTLSKYWTPGEVKAITKGFSKLVAVSEATKKDAESLGLEVEDFIHNPINLEYLDERSKEFSVNHEDYIIFVGRLDPNKGVHELLDAFSLLTDKSIQLLYVGTGQEEKKLKKEVKEKKLGKRVHFLGLQENSIPYIKNARVLVLPSQHEACPYVCAEALLMKTQIVVSDFPGAKAFYSSDSIIPLSPSSNFTQRLATIITTQISTDKMNDYPLKPNEHLHKYINIS